MIYDLVAHLERQRAWSTATFGPGKRIGGVLDHMDREKIEVIESDGALEEWVDLALLALDGCWRSGASPLEVVAAIAAKLEINEARTWPDWRRFGDDVAITHER